MTRLLWVLVIALFGVRVTDAHAHLCFDGQEKPLSVHVEDFGSAHAPEEHTGGPHDDLDVPVTADALPKKADELAQADSVPPPAAAILLPVPRRSWRTPAERSHSALIPAFPPLFQPPARAPPR